MSGEGDGASTHKAAPLLRVLSLGAGRQSTALAILAARGKLEPLDLAIFADTGWEPASVYAHLDRLEAEVLRPAGIELARVSVGNIREDALNPARRFASMPLYILNRDGTAGMGRRQCTSEYKLKPIRRELRRRLGAPVAEDGTVGRVPAGRYAEQWIGFSVDERGRALDAKSTRYDVSRFPLLELGLSVDDCVAIVEAAGFHPQKSACIGCPFHANAQWRRMRDTDPASWADAVEFDRAIRAGNARANATGRELLEQAFLHRSRVALDAAPIDHVTAAERRSAQGDLVSMLSAEQAAAALDDDDADVIGCGPHTCRVAGDPEDEELAP